MTVALICPQKFDGRCLLNSEEILNMHNKVSLKSAKTKERFEIRQKFIQFMSVVSIINLTLHSFCPFQKFLR